MEKENIILTVGNQNHTGFVVSVETIVRRGIFQFEIIGLANKTISESKQRILSAVSFSLREKRHYINKKITTLLSPADSKKEGSHFDLPIAISYLISVKNLLGNDQKHLKDFGLFSNIIILGELTLTGSILPIKNISALIRVGINEGVTHYIVPEGNKAECIKFEDISIWSIQHLSEICSLLEEVKSNNKDINGSKDKLKEKLLLKFEKISHDKKEIEDINIKKDTQKVFLLDSIAGNATAKRALEITHACSRRINGRYQTQMPSRFIFDL
jgi:magnesium chelatase family protein